MSLRDRWPVPLASQLTYVLTRLLIQRALALVYCIAFLIVLRQYLPLLGEDGLLPARAYLARAVFWQTPSLFWFHASDGSLMGFAWCGLVFSILALTGFSERWGDGVSAGVWGLLWLLYLSYVNAGQVFYGFGWESILLETGFLAIFLGSGRSAPPRILIWLFRWVLFRVMFGAGLIKWRGDSCWRDLTCMMVHYETQPIPNPISWYFHHLPPSVHRLEVLGTHAVELLVPWGFFLTRRIAAVAGIITAAFQGLLILSGNLSWLNYMTLVLCLACFDDRWFSRWFPGQTAELPVPHSRFRKGILGLLTGMVVLLSIPPVTNLFSPGQRMNARYNPLHLVNTYGAFGSVTKVRREIILEGTRDKTIGPDTRWLPYEFKCKPGNVARPPCFVSPYHYRLDWQMWFAAMSAYRFQPWILNAAAKLLQNDPAFLRLLAANPFPDSPPKFVRAELYAYRFTSPAERGETGHWWVRERVGVYLDPLSMDHPVFMKLLRDQGWLPKAG